MRFTARRPKAAPHVRRSDPRPRASVRTARYSGTLAYRPCPNSPRSEAWNSSKPGVRITLPASISSLLRLLLVAHRSGRARLHALHALAAQAARQAPFGLRDGLLHAVTAVDLAEVPDRAPPPRPAASSRVPAAERRAADCSPSRPGRTPAPAPSSRLAETRRSPRRPCAPAPSHPPWTPVPAPHRRPRTGPGMPVASVSRSATIRPPGPVSTP